VAFERGPEGNGAFPVGGHEVMTPLGAGKAGR